MIKVYEVTGKMWLMAVLTTYCTVEIGKWAQFTLIYIFRNNRASSIADANWKWLPKYVYKMSTALKHAQISMQTAIQPLEWGSEEKNKMYSSKSHCPNHSWYANS